jgi:aminoglycoside 3-N-acetyltransferase I
MSGSIEIRKLDVSEIALAKSLILLFGDDDGNEENFSIPSDEYVSEMLSRADFHAIVALENGRLAGGLTAYEMKMFKRAANEMFLYEIEVAEPYRQKGIGKDLVEYLKQICVARGIVEMFVGTSKDNRAARKLYETTGGKPDEDSIWFNYLFE